MKKKGKKFSSNSIINIQEINVTIINESPKKGMSMKGIFDFIKLGTSIIEHYPMVIQWLTYITDLF